MDVIQITDLHITKEGDLFGYDTYHRLSKAVNKIGTIIQNHKNPLLLVTGDISQDGTIESYKKVFDLLKKLNCKIFWLHGNHDDLETLKLVSSNYQNMHELNLITIRNWAFIKLDSVKTGSDIGYIKNDDIETLEDRIKGLPDKNIAIVMHHHPIDSGTPLVDESKIENHEVLLELIKRQKNIKVIICGHAHNNYSIPYESANVEIAPASCFQWLKGTKNISTVDAIGYTVYKFQTNTYTKNCFYLNSLNNS